MYIQWHFVRSECCPGSVVLWFHIFLPPNHNLLSVYPRMDISIVSPFWLVWRIGTRLCTNVLNILPSLGQNVQHPQLHPGPTAPSWAEEPGGEKGQLMEVRDKKRKEGEVGTRPPGSHPKCPALPTGHQLLPTHSAAALTDVWMDRWAQHLPATRAWENCGEILHLNRNTDVCFHFSVAWSLYGQVSEASSRRLCHSISLILYKVSKLCTTLILMCLIIASDSYEEELITVCVCISLLTDQAGPLFYVHWPSYINTEGKCLFKAFTCFYWTYCVLLKEFSAS